MRGEFLNTTTLVVALALSVTLTGCAAPLLGLAAAQGATAAVAVSLGPLDDLRERTAEDQCRVLADRGVSITESLESGSPANEGVALMFEPAYWRAEFAREGYPQVERSRTPLEGTLAVTDRSLTFIPLAGAVSVRIPYELVRNVEVRGDPAGTPISLVVASCQGRYDVVTFRRQGKSDPVMISDAATSIRARFTTWRTGARN